jgi:hypothetical protein
MKEVAVSLRALRGYIIEIAKTSVLGSIGSGNGERACLVKEKVDKKKETN